MTSTKTVQMPMLTDRRRPYHFVTALLALDRLGIDLHQVDLLAAGTFRRYRGEIYNQEPQAGQPLTPDTSIVLEVGFAGVVDFLPYQFFTGLGSAAPAGGAWEDNARRFWAPWEGNYIRYQALAMGRQLRYSLAQADQAQLRRFLGLFDFDPTGHARDDRELRLWSALLPTFHYWAGNAEHVARVMTLLLDRQITISENTPASFAIPTGLQSRLGGKNNAIGSTMVLGEEFAECDSACTVHVHEIAAADVDAWMPGGSLRKRIEWLLELALPSSIKIDLRLHFAHGSTAGKLAGRLGYTSWMGVHQPELNS